MLTKADTAVPNVIPAFLSFPGELGVRDDREQRVHDQWEYYLRRSICTPDAVLHANAVAQSLNTMHFTNVNTATTVMKSIIGADGQYPKERRYCWFESTISERQIADFVKYKFKQFGLMGTRFDYFSRIFFWWFISHLIISNFYYRGIVYVVCGPRGKVKEKYLRKEPEPHPIEAGEIGEEIS